MSSEDGSHEGRETMSQLKIATFNLENLFSRYRLLDTSDAGVHVQLVGATSIDYQGRPLSEGITQSQRNNTARAILDSQPDILAVEEVEDLWTLRCFNDEYLGGYFDRMIMLAGNDGRGINVGLCVSSKCAANIQGIRTHMDDIDPADGKATRVNRYYNSVTNEITVDHALFSRDCLEVDIEAWATPLTFLVNHFKAQDKYEKSTTGDLRRHQAARVAQIVGEVQRNGRKVVVLGDLNADWTANTTLQALKDLVTAGTLADPFKDVSDPWTHFYDVANETSRLDYILLDGAFAKSFDLPTILRKGVTLKCTAAGERYPTIGYVGTEASDHCLVSVTLNL
jgi:endonuclease/exonuclease/phosphatase family metal-dependent hydrolase